MLYGSQQSYLLELHRHHLDVLVLQVRQSERTTAQEVQMTQMELEQQLGGLFGLLTSELLVPYLNRKLTIFQKTGEIPRIPKGMVKPIIVAGINALGRGQDVQALGAFLTTISQTTVSYTHLRAHET